MFYTPAVHLRRGTSLINTLKNLGLTTNLQVCLDAGDLNSYSGSGEFWNDLSGNALNAINGTGSGDTTYNWDFNGTAGRQSVSEYWSRNASGSIWRIPRQTWMDAVYKDGGKFTVCMWVRSDQYSSLNLNTYDGTGVVGGTAYPGFEVGPANGTNGTTLGALEFAARRGDGNFAGTAFGTTVIPTNAWTFTAVAIDEAAGTYVLQVNGTQQTGAITYVSPAATSGSRDMVITRGGSDTPWCNSIAMWNVGQSTTNLTAIYEMTKGKFGL